MTSKLRRNISIPVLLRKPHRQMLPGPVEDSSIQSMIVVYPPSTTFRSKNGISRVISEMSRYFSGNLLVLTGAHFPELSFEIYSNHLEARNRPSVLRRILRGNNKMIILNPHGPTTTFWACLVKLYLRDKRTRISAFFYDEEDIIPSVGRGSLARALRFFRISEVLLWLFLKVNILNEIIVLDNRMLDLVRKRYRSSKVKVVRMGVSPNLLRYRREGKTMGSPAVIFFHGVLIPRRRVQDLIFAVSRLKKPVVLRIGGSADANRGYYLYLVELARKLGLEDRSHFLGELEEDDLAREYQGCDVFVFPCDRQTWGIAPLEAMVFRKPVVVSTGAGVSEVLNDRTAVLVPPRDPERLADAIQLLTSNKEMREQLADAGSKYVTANLTFENTARELRRIWKI